MSNPPPPSDRRRQEARAASDDLMQMVLGMVQTDASQTGLGPLLDKMDGIVSQFGLAVPGFADHLQALRTATETTSLRERLQAAAEWAGDTARLKALQGGPWPDTAHLLPDALAFAGIELDLVEGAGFDEAGEPATQGAPLPDPFADLADGLPGAAEALIASGVDLNVPAGPEGRTALQAALEAPGRRVDPLTRLIAAGADLARCGIDGEDPIFCAIGYPHPATVTPESERAIFDLLFRHGSSPNAPSDFFGTATLASVLLGSADEVGLMLDAGGRLNVCRPAWFPGHKLAGFTPLMLAAPKPDVFRLLLERGADPKAPCPSGEPLEGFLAGEARRAAELADHDAWCQAHAAALAASLAHLRGA